VDGFQLLPGNVHSFVTWAPKSYCFLVTVERRSLAVTRDACVEIRCLHRSLDGKNPYHQWGLQESARLFTPSTVCLVLDLGFRVWAGLGLVGFRLRYSLDRGRPLDLRFSSCWVGLVAFDGVASSCRLLFELG
jgi:hypothetical protein